MGLYDRLHAVDDDPTRLSKQDRDLFEEQSLKLDAVHKKHARPSWHQFSVDKAWQAIHFLLTGEIEGGSPPLAWAVLGGLELADEKNYTGGSPLRILSPEQVREVAEALSGFLLSDYCRESRSPRWSQRRFTLYRKTKNRSASIFACTTRDYKGSTSTRRKKGTGCFSC